MKSIIVCLCALVVVSLARPEEHYTSQYDSINLKEVLENDRLLEAYFKCIIGKGKCTPEGKELKSHIKEAMEQDCLKCTEAQRSGTETVIGHLIKHKPGYWNELKAQFDPSGTYTKKYEARLAKLQA